MSAILDLRKHLKSNPETAKLLMPSTKYEALLDLVKIVIKDIKGIAEVTSFKTEKKTYGVAISINISLFYGYDAQSILSKTQQRIGAAIEEFTSITINEVNVRADRLVHSEA